MIAGRIILQFFVLISITILIGLTAFSGASPWLLIPLFGVITYSITYFYVSWKYYTAQHKNSPTKRMLPDVDAAIKASEEFRQQMSRGEAYAFLSYLCSPAISIERISESVEVLGRTLQVNSSSTFKMYPNAYLHGTCILPIELVQRGHLVDGLRLFGPSGGRISSLARDNASGYILAVLTEYLTSLGSSTLDQFQKSTINYPEFADSADNEKKVMTLEEAVVRVVSSDTPYSAGDIQDLTDAMFALPCKRQKREGLKDCAAVVRELASHYLILVEVPCRSDENASNAGGNSRQARLRIAATRRIIPFRHNTDVSLRKSNRIEQIIDFLRNSTRRLLGVQSALVSYPLVNSRRAQSFHIEIKGPEGTYLGRQRVVTQPNNIEVDLNDVRCAMQPRFGQRHSHLYVHNAVELRNAYFENHFFERVPGSIGRATITSLAAFILITLCALTKLDVGYVTGTDLLAVLLAAPAVAAGWAGLGGGDRITGESLVARVAQIETFVMSLFTAWLFAALPKAHHPHDHGFSIVKVNEDPWGWLWLLVVLSQGAALLAIGACWGFRSAVQEHFVRRERRYK